MICKRGLVEFEKTGMVLGVVEDQEYEVRGPISLDAGDLIFVRTDGVEETMNSSREIYGVDRLKSYLVENQALTSTELLKKLDSTLQEHAGDQEAEDDVTMISLKIL